MIVIYSVYVLFNWSELSCLDTLTFGEGMDVCMNVQNHPCALTCVQMVINHLVTHERLRLIVIILALQQMQKS